MAKAVTKPLPTAEPEELSTWRSLDRRIMELEEDACWALLSYEKEHKGRHLFLQRIYGRASTLRAKRESAEVRRATKDREV